jgi:hypothetical protein
MLRANEFGFAGTQILMTRACFRAPSKRRDPARQSVDLALNSPLARRALIQVILCRMYF